jgi:hypothetical protein
MLETSKAMPAELREQLEQDGVRQTGAPAHPPTRLPRRDYFILPVISLVTLISLFAASEVTCRVFWGEQNLNPCRIDDPSGTYYRPNCVSHLKFPEGPWIENRYNECGYRNNQSCGPKRPGVFRIVILGSSMVSGWGVPYEQTLVPLTMSGLSRGCSRKIEIQNISTSGNLLHIYHRTDEALALQPDLVVLLLGPIDTRGWYARADIANRNNPQFKPSPGPAMFETRSHRLVRLTGQSRSLVVAKHFLYQDAAFSIRTFALHPLDLDYMLVPPTPSWKQDVADLDLLIGEMADRLRARGTPLVLLPTVSQWQALLLSSHSSPAGFDPREFQVDLAAIGNAHDVAVLNVYEDFTDIPYTRLFYTTDGHPNGDGYAVLSRAFVREMLSKDIIPGCQSAPAQVSQ